MNNFSYNDSVLASYERSNLNPDRYSSWDSRAYKSLKDQIKALEATIDAIESMPERTREMQDDLDASYEELHDLRQQLKELIL